MKTLLVFFTLIMFTSISHAALFVSVQDGPWTDPATWGLGGGSGPGGSDDVTISHIVTVGAPLSIGGIVIINTGGELNNSGFTTTFAGWAKSLTLHSGGTLKGGSIVIDYPDPSTPNSLNGTITASSFFTIRGSTSALGTPTITATTANFLGNAGGVNFSAVTTISTTNMTVSGSAKLTLDGDITATGTLTVNGAGGFDHNSGTITTTTVVVTNGSNLKTDGTLNASGDISVSGALATTISGTGTISYGSFSPAYEGVGLTCNDNTVRTISNPPPTPFDLSTCDIVLPVTYTYFNHSCNNNAIEWQTAIEEDNNYFVVEVSNDLTSYKTISQVQGNGTSAISHTYAYTIESEEFHYYRLKQVDYNGDYEYSKIAVNNCYTPNTSSTYIYPSISNVFYLNHDYANATEIVKVEIFNITGQRITSKDYDIYNSNEEINLSRFSEGTYIAQIKTGSFNKSVKIIKY